ncbi:FAD-binding oxidoreductase [Amycolatopsis thermophila]|uniref:Glycolate oxidase FAD binding subunit n=1 Tax=Amycolatopsis thermophila TaxID=206084 RepID=A0ABU0F1D0_9PSEU|nr:FAD-binding oxidoreductase [Amycolatopsis thermophila]MDQ0381326.1 glycolate oxidase FAD binding subunit [Amycolatopsis thermophila]
MRAAGDLVLDELSATAAARRAGEDDRVDGVPARVVAEPSTTDEAAAVMRVAAARGLAVVPRGAGTKLSWGHPPERADLVLGTGRMDRIIEHRAGDLVVHVQAGVRLDALQEHLAPARQRLGISPVLPPGAGPGTVGGVLATAATGPLRLSHGAVRDLLIGVTLVRADGTVAKAGGKVVKNVAGYDLGKLLTGSWGTLGLVTEAVFRLHPLPPAARWVVVPVRSAADAHEKVQRVVHSQVVASALELDRPADGPASLAVLVEGIPQGVEGRVRTLLDLLGDAEVTDHAPAWWGHAPWESGGVALRLTHEIAGLPRLLDALGGAAVRGSPGVGVLHAGVPADPEAVPAFVERVRGASAGWGGDIVVLDAPAPVKAALDVWGPVRGITLMRRVKDQFDPDRLMAPGRFAGGI